MSKGNRFLIRNDLPGCFTLNVEPEGAFVSVAHGEEVSVTDQFSEYPVTITLSASAQGEPIVSIWPGDGEVKIEKNGMDAEQGRLSEG